MSDNTIKVNIQGSTLKFELSIDKNDTILAVKEKICSQVMPDCQPTTLKLIYSGRILKDQQLVSECSLQDGHTVHLVKSSSVKTNSSTASTTSATTAVPTATPIPPPNAEFGNQPQLENLMQMLSGQANPTTQQQTPSNPMDLMMAAMMEEMAKNPQLLPQLMATQPEAYGRLGPGSLELAQNPEFLRMAAQMMRSGALSAAGGAQGGRMDPAALAAMLNQQQQSTPTSPPASNQPPEERFQSQLSQLQDMGFWDKKSNIQALLISNGSVSQAIEYLLANPPE